MATTHISARIYGEMQGNDLNYPARIISFANANIVSFPVADVAFFPFNSGVQMANGAYVYSVIETAPSGLNVEGAKLVTDLTVSALQTLANA